MEKRIKDEGKEGREKLEVEGRFGNEGPPLLSLLVINKTRWYTLFTYDLRADSRVTVDPLDRSCDMNSFHANGRLSNAYHTRV